MKLKTIIFAVATAFTSQGVYADTLESKDAIASPDGISSNIEALEEHYGTYQDLYAQFKENGFCLTDELYADLEAAKSDAEAAFGKAFTTFEQMDNVDNPIQYGDLSIEFASAKRKLDSLEESQNIVEMGRQRTDCPRPAS